MKRYLIDITRFISRIGRGHPTGIDRVEIEYIKECTRRDGNSLAVAKLGDIYIVLPTRDVVNILPAVLTGQMLGRPSLRDFARLKLPMAQRAARTAFRRRATFKGSDIDKVLLRLDLAGFEYVNVGHANLTNQMFDAVRTAGCADITVMVHDMIPLDFPQYAQPHIPAQFEEKMKVVAHYATRVICNSHDTMTRAAWYFAKWTDLEPEMTVAHLGVEPLAHREVEKRKGPAEFVVLGTIEPRKNHLALMQAWQLMADAKIEPMPQLHIIGRRGWMNEDVFELLDSSPLMGVSVFEHADLDDAGLADRLSRATALLFPSHAEGFGLPALEALQIGVPVACSNLDVFREILGDAALYVEGDQAQDWLGAVEKIIKSASTGELSGVTPIDVAIIPRWRSHFRHVFGQNETQR